MRKVVFLLSITLLLFSCKNKEQKPDNLLVEVDGFMLFKEDLHEVLPTGLNSDDSLLFAENYIRNWIEDVLLFEKAQANIPENADIDELVENYRKALIVHTYQQELLRQRLSAQIPEEEIAAYYEENKQLFTLERPLIKGLFLKVPLGAPRINEVRRWYKSSSIDAVENLEKYSLQHAMNYDYFYDKWVPVVEILGKLPIHEADPEEYLNRNRQIELKDSTFYYFLHITDYLAKGDQAPYDFAHASAKEMLLNMKKTTFIKRIKADLYQEAVSRNKIIYNDE